MLPVLQAHEGGTSHVLAPTRLSRHNQYTISTQRFE